MLIDFIKSSFYSKNNKFFSPKSWFAFGKNRTIFIPNVSRKVQYYACDFFISNKWQRAAIKFVLFIGIGAKINKSSGSKWGEIEDSIAQADLNAKNLMHPPNNLSYAIRQGSTGPYQKISLVAINESGAPEFYIKVAVGEQADSMISAESLHLQRLTNIPELRNSVPQQLNSGNTVSGRKFFTSSVSPFLNTRTVFGVKHMEFLATLGHATKIDTQYSNSAEFNYARETLASLSTILGDTVYKELLSASQLIANEFGTEIIPTVCAHRDFAPWNIHVNNTQFFAFDWEYAFDGANPLYDFFHFHLIQKSLQRGDNSLKIANINLLFPPALAYLKTYFIGYNWCEKLVRLLLLGYLIDLVLFYVDSDKKYDPNHPVIYGYSNLITDRNEWLKLEG